MSGPDYGIVGYKSSDDEDIITENLHVSYGIVRFLNHHHHSGKQLNLFQMSYICSQ